MVDVSDRPHFQDTEEPDVAQYRAISTLAVLALLLGLLSLLALLGPSLWWIPPAAIIMSLLALRRLKAFAPALVGRKAAVLGLFLAVLAGSAGPANWLVYRRQIREEGKRFAQMWFDFLASRQPHKALQLGEPPSVRQPLDEGLWEYYPEGSGSRERLEEFLSRREIRALIALGDKANIRYFDTEWQGNEGAKDALNLSYAVTYQPGGRPTTFFVGVSLARTFDENTKRAYWQVENVKGGLHPNALGGEPKG